MQIKSNDDNLLVGPRVSRRQSSYGAPAAPTSYDAPILPLSSSSSSYSSPSSSSASTSYSPSSTSGSSSGSSFRPSTGGSLASSAAAQPIYGPVGDGKFCCCGKSGSRSIGGKKVKVLVEQTADFMYILKITIVVKVRAKVKTI